MGAERADDVIVTQLNIIHEESLLLQDNLDDWRQVNFTFILKKSVKEDLRNCLTLVLEFMEHVLLETISNMQRTRE